MIARKWLWLQELHSFDSKLGRKGGARATLRVVPTSDNRCAVSCIRHHGKDVSGLTRWVGALRRTNAEHKRRTHPDMFIEPSQCKIGTTVLALPTVGSPTLSTENANAQPPPNKTKQIPTQLSRRSYSPGVDPVRMW